jgi:diguanylate cyclase (GGDEF)-like protein
MKCLAELISDPKNLPSPPKITFRIIEAVKQDDCFQELAEIISSDPALASKIMMSANSAFYNVTGQVASLQKALTLLGTNTLKGLALSFVIANGFRSHSDQGFDYDYFWKRSLFNGIAARAFASSLTKSQADFFLMGLLQDIGIVIMYKCRSNKYLQVLDSKRGSGESLTEAETRIFGFDHQQVGQEVLKHWGLPDDIALPIGLHHEDQPPEHLRLPSSILRLAHLLSSAYSGASSVQSFNRIKDRLRDEHGLDEDTVSGLIDRCAEEYSEMLSLFDFPPERMKPYSTMLEEANQELEKLNLSYQQVVLELKYAKKRAETLAQDLIKANSQLRELAYRDSLTGLYNHRFFREMLQREMQRAKRYDKLLSLILFDIDHFKSINDTYGHPAGDRVLQRLSQEAGRIIRDSDILSRCGGEEFALILPETGLKGAVVFAERLRRSVQETGFIVQDNRISVTISLGMTTCSAGCLSKPIDRIIEAADKALYTAKQNGRNTFSYTALSEKIGHAAGDLSAKQA